MAKGTNCREKKGRLTKFPEKLMTMLENAEAKEYDHIVSWCGDGRSFTVKDKDLFIEEVSPAYFQRQKWRSFNRQLTTWGFYRFHKRNSTTFGHPIFRRGEPESLKRMKRSIAEEKKVQGNGNFDGMMVLP